MTKIRYIGLKPSKADNVAGTGVRWSGQGDVQEVPERAVPYLLQHPAVWGLASDDYDAPRKIDAPAAVEPPVPGAEQRFKHEPNYEGSVYALRDTESDEVLDLAGWSDKDLKAFARVNGIKADLRKRGEELRASIVAAVIVASDPKE